MRETLGAVGFELELDTLLADGAESLSSGQRRRLLLARALCTDAQVLLLDEITANLDAATEARVLEALKRASKGRTVLSVSHRIYENLGGRTVEIGSTDSSDAETA